MSLLRDIQDAAVDPTVDVSFLLRKCKILAARLANAEFSAWIDQELNGYRDVKALPDYRVFHVQSKGHFSGPAGSGIRNADIPLSCIDKRFRKQLQTSYCMQPISAYVDLLSRGDGGSFQESWSPDLVAHVAGDIYQYMNCMAAWKVIPRPAIVGLVDAVRNRILNFVLEIEAEAPDAGEAAPNTPPLPQEQVTQIFHTHIHGNVGNIAQGNKEVVQNATVTVSQGDLESLKDYLSSLGLQSEQLSDLEAAIQDDPAEEVQANKSLGARVTSWLGATLSAVAQGLIPVIQNVDANLITHALLMYYGIQ